MVSLPGAEIAHLYTFRRVARDGMTGIDRGRSFVVLPARRMQLSLKIDAA
jgi:hypothetical protein